MTRYLQMIRRHAITLSTVAVLALLTPATTKAADFSDNQMKSFAMATVAINEIAERWQPQIRAAATEDQAATMLRQVDTEMRQAIESTDGIGVDEYQSIMEAVQADPDLKSRIDTMLKEVTPQQ